MRVPGRPLGTMAAARQGARHRRQGSFSESLDTLALKLGLSGPMGPARLQLVAGLGAGQALRGPSSSAQVPPPPRAIPAPHWMCKLSDGRDAASCAGSSRPSKRARILSAQLRA